MKKKRNILFYFLIALILSLLAVMGVAYYLLIIVGAALLLTIKSIKQVIAKKHSAKLIESLPGTIDFIGRSIQSGDSYMVAIKKVAQANLITSPDFIAIDEALTRGLDLTETLKKRALKVNQPDFTFFTALLIIQYESDEHSAKSMYQLADLLRKKIDLRKRVKTMSAEARLSGYLLALLPLIVFLAVRLLSPAYLVPLLYTSLGQKLMVIAVCSNLWGLFVIRKMTEFRI